MSSKFNLVVQKYGGSSLSDPQKLAMVAQFIKDKLNDCDRICVVVSAMGDKTNELLDLAHSVSNDPNKRELDMLISCGERVSMALLAMALCDLGVRAKSLTGSQSGIVTDTNHRNAEIIAVRPERALAEFNNHQVIIVAGFQGVSLEKEITTLKRGGSDTTAVAMAAALDAQAVEIFSDVPGLLDADPKIVTGAHTIERLSFGRAEGLALYGAKVVAHDAIKLAAKFNIRIDLKKCGDKKTHTSIAEGIANTDNSPPIIAITHLRGLLCAPFNETDINEVQFSAGYFLCGAKKGDQFFGYFSNDIAQELVNGGASIAKKGLALITLHLSANEYVGPALNKCQELLRNGGIECVDNIVGRNEIFVVVDDAKLTDALTILHSELHSLGRGR